MPETQRPYCVALVVCEVVHRCPDTGKFSMLGTLNDLKPIQFPTLAPLSVYFALTDGLGHCRIGLRIVESGSLFADEAVEVGAANFPDLATEIEFVDPLEVVEQIVDIHLQIYRAGVYLCELYAGNDEQVLMSRRLNVQERVDSGESHE